jgi:hypothetical protein
MMDGFAGGHGGHGHGADGLGGSHDVGHHAQYVAVGSGGHADVSASFVHNHERGSHQVGSHSSADVYASYVHSHESRGHHVGVHSHHVDTHPVHFDHMTLLEALDASPSAPLIFNTPTHKPDGQVIRSYLAYVDRHGQFDVTCELARIGAQFGIIHLDKFRPNFEEFGLVRYEILDRQAWRQVQAEEGGEVAKEVYCACENEAAPGWYEGATGLTRLHRQHWQIGKVDGLGIYAKPEYDSKAHTWLEIEVTKWEYLETGDFGTALEIRIISLSELDNTSGQVGYRREPFIRHQRMAIKLFEYMLAKLLSVEKTPAQKLLRAEVDRKHPPVCRHLDSHESASPIAGETGDESHSQATGKTAAPTGQLADVVILVDDW